MRIGDVAAAAGVSVRSLRYYEEHGLLHAERTAGGQRAYDIDAVERVRMLQHLYAAGLSSAKIARLLPCVDLPSARATAESVALMREEFSRLSAQIDELQAARDHLGQILADASAHLEDARPPV